MSKFRIRVKKIRTREVSVYVASRRGRPDEIHIIANKDTIIHMAIRGVKAEKIEKEPPLPTPEEMFDRIMPSEGERVENG